MLSLVLLNTKADPAFCQLRWGVTLSLVADAQGNEPSARAKAPLSFFIVAFRSAKEALLSRSERRL